MTTEGLTLPGISVGGSGAGAADRAKPRAGRVLHSLTARGKAVPPIVRDAVIIFIAVLDVWLVIPEGAQTYSVVLSALSCLALTAHRRFPFLVVLATVPGFLAGWAQLAAMIALGLLATRKQSHWQVWAAAGLVWLSRTVLWPISDFLSQSWREHVLFAIYGVLVAGMPVAIGLLIGARTELSARLAELAASRDREQRLHEQAVRAEERARLARDMHDLVSHDITLIAMQAGALSVSNTSAEAKQSARTIRQLSTHTLEELRSLVGTLRSDNDHACQPDLAQLPQLVCNTDTPVQLTMEHVPDELPPQVSAAAYRTVQECLTNVQKHAPGATAAVRVKVDEHELRIEVRNNRPRERTPELPSGGHGLAGLAERADLLGGTFTTTVTEDGGFLVEASYPLSVSEPVGA